MIEMGKKYQTRDGRAVRILATDFKGQPYGVPVCAAITERNGNETLFLYDANGRYNINHEPEEDERNLDSDLVPVPTKHEGWMPMSYDKDAGYWINGRVYDSREEVRATAAFTCVAHVTWED